MILLSGAPVRAQNAPKADVTSQPSKLILVVGVGKDKRMTGPIMQTVMKSALEKSGCSCAGDPVVTDISPAFFAEFQKIVNLTRGDTLPPGEGDGVLLQPEFDSLITDFPHIYKLTMKSPGRYLSSLEITYPDEKKETFKAKDTDRVTRLGIDEEKRESYRVRLPMPPKEYVVTASRLDGDDEVYKGNWPRTRAHYAVTFNDFKGNFNALRDKLLDKEVDPINEPVDSIEEFSDTRFLLASMGFMMGGGPITKADGFIGVEVTPVGSGIDAVWVKLPFSRDEVEKEVKAWNALPEGKAVIKQLESEGPVPVSESVAVLKSDAKPKWYQLKKAGKTFTGSWKLESSDRRNLLQRFPQMYMVVIQQTDEGAKAIASQIENDWTAKILIQDADLNPSPPPSEAPVKNAK